MKPQTSDAGQGGRKRNWADWPKLATDKGHFNMRITADGRWYHEGREIKRLALVKLFASVLRPDEQGGFQLVTPVEKGKIDVDDAPFIVTDFRLDSADDAPPVIWLETSLGQAFPLGADHALCMRPSRDCGEMRAYAEVRPGLWGLVHRNVFYDLVALAKEEAGHVWLHSGGVAFDLGATHDA